MSTTTYTSSAALARAFVAALNSRDFVTLKAVLSSDVEFHFLPSSVGLPPAIGVEAAAGGIEQICKLIPDFTVTINDLIESESKVWVYGSGTGKSVDGREYKNEYVNMLDLVRIEDGTLRVKRTREFMDSKFAVAFFFGGAQ